MPTVWKECLKKLKDIVPIEEYTQNLQHIKVKQNKNTLTLLAKNANSLSWINTNIYYTINSIITKNNSHIQLKITVDDQKDSRPNMTNLIKKLNHQLIPEYTFDNLIIGDSNQIAHHAAKQIARQPEISEHFPFIIYGDCGLGKTHLLHAIGHLANESNPNLKIIYTPLIEFVKNITSGIRHQQIETIKKCYQAADLLLVDDIHHIAEKEKTQEEFFHIFDYLFKNKKQIILTCDQIPNHLKQVEKRLVSRLTQGLVLPIKKPGLEMRTAILINKANQANININEEVALFLASKIVNNVRELEGALSRLKAIANFKQNNNLDINQIKEDLSDLINHDSKIININVIQEVICRYYGITHSSLISKKRTKDLVYPRQMAMYLTTKFTNLSLSDIGSHFKRDHTTVLHANKKIKYEITYKINIQEDYKNLELKIGDT